MLSQDLRIGKVGPFPGVSSASITVMFVFFWKLFQRTGQFDPFNPRWERDPQPVQFETQIGVGLPRFGELVADKSPRLPVSEPFTSSPSQILSAAHCPDS